MRQMFPLLAMIGCAPKPSSGSDASLFFLVPVEGETVSAGDVQVSFIVEKFELVPPETARVSPPGLAWLVPSARAHSGDAEAGYVAFSLDEGESVLAWDTSLVLPNVAAGNHTLEAALHYADGHPVGVSESVSFNAE